jgi:aminobenzoyl-glutamate transport protein
MAPVFVPMLMLLGIPPAVTQAAYRVGDSCTNPVTPLNPYFPLVLALAARYVPGVRIGTVVALMVPYGVAFLAAWIALFVAWVTLGIPFGPG